MTFARYTSSQLKAVTIQKGNEDEAWGQVREATHRWLTPWGESILRYGVNDTRRPIPPYLQGQGLEGKIGTILVEPLYICKDFRNLFSRFYSKKFASRPSECSRLHFYASPDVTVANMARCSGDLQKSYVGYSVVQPVYDRCIGRTVFDPHKLGRPQADNFCLRTRFKVHISGTEYFVCGFPYRSQSTEATVCAHTALWAACRYLSESYSMYGDVYPYDLVEMTGDTEGRRVPYRGMQYTDYSSILSQFGCYPAIVRPKGNWQFDPSTQTWSVEEWGRDRDAFFDLYAYVESGFPVLTSFNGHVLNVIGHTLKDTIDPGEQADEHGFYNSCCLLKRYIVVDDNLFPYQELGYKGDAENYGQVYQSLPHFPCIDSVLAAVVPLPEKAFLPAKYARKLCYNWYDRPESRQHIVNVTLSIVCLESETLIAMLFLTSSTSFKKR